RRLGLPTVRATGCAIALAHEPTAGNDGVAALRAHGIEVREGPPPPVLDGARPNAVWWVPDELAIHPVALCEELARRAEAQGAQLRFGVTARGLLRSGSAVVGVDTEQGPIEASAVVVAAGAWSDALAATAGVHRTLVPLRRTVVRLAAPVPPGHPW